MKKKLQVRFNMKLNEFLKQLIDLHIYQHPFELYGVEC